MNNLPPPLTFDAGDDLFAVPVAKVPRGPHTGRGHPDTSRNAADKVRPAVGSIRQQVEDFFKRAGHAGSIDDAMLEALSPDDRSRADNSFRPRRVELVDANVILDSGRRGKNGNGNDCVVWVHRDFIPGAPPVVEVGKGRERPEKEIAPDLKAKGQALSREMKQWSTSMRNEGRVAFASALDAAAETVRLLSI